MRRAAVPAGLLPLLAGLLAAAAGIAAAASSLALDGVTPADATLHTLCVVGFAVAGTAAWRRRPASRAGALLVLTGAVLAPLPLLLAEDAPVLRALAMHTPGWFGPTLAHLLLGFPSGRVVSPPLKRVLAVAYAHVTLGTALLLLFYVPPASCRGCADGPWIGALGDRGTYEALNVVHTGGSLVLLVAVALAIARRRRRATPAARRVHTPVLLAGLVSAAVIGLTLPFLNRMIDGDEPPIAIQALWTAAWLIVPVTTLVGLVRLRAARFDLRDVVAALDSDVPPLGLRDALARALGDPSVQLGFWVPELAEHRDVEGRPLRLDGDRAITPLGPRRAGVAPAILVHDPALLEDDGLLDAVAGAAALALEHERLHAEVRTHLAEVRSARARLVEAEDAARRRTERDLHDGAQQTLVSLALALRMLEDALDPDEDAAAVPHARAASAAADRALTDLRELARGVYPAVLSLDGLGPAVEELAARATLPVALTSAVDGRPDAAIEAAAFFVVREALRNADVHAGAGRAGIDVRGDGTTLVVTVTDDGHGGAAVRDRGGLRHLADRVSALGGRFDLRAGPAGGTVLRAELPWRPYAASPSASASAPADSWSLRTNGSPLSRTRVP